MAAPGCPACGLPVGDGDRFCENCGTNLVLRRTRVGGPVSAREPVCRDCGGRYSDDGFCEECGHARPAPRDRMAADFGVVAGVSDRGRVRARNEDSMAFAVLGQETAPHTVVIVVCDGVGSTRRADEASQAAVDAALERILECLEAGKRPYESTVDGVAAAFDAVARLADTGSPEVAPSCTLVSAVAKAGEITVGWIGDSRAYWLSEVDSRAVTTDDTLFAQLLAAGLPEREAGEEANAHALARWIGADAEPGLPSVEVLRPSTPGTLVVCSDGLWNYLPAPEDIAVHLGGSPARAAAALTDAAIELGGGDNITVVVLPHPFETGNRAHE